MLAVCLIAMMATFSFSVAASAETRSLKLYYIHTKEKANIVYKKNGRYVSGGLKKINRFLRDWRRNEPTKMDPALLDLVWEAYRKTGSRKYIHVVSAYRSPATNAMLRKTRGGQAKKSQHMLGKAMDFYIPGVSVKKLREIGFKLGGGGVGYYPRSGVPFVHLDTGNVRSWPRMSRRELTRLFPRGGTLHLPTDGKPLPGYKQALATYKARKNGRRAPVVKETKPNSGGGNLLAAIFRGRDKEKDNNVPSKARKTATQRQAPKATPKPVDTPRTLLASLPRRSLPVPVAAPRARSVKQPAVPVAVQPVATSAPRPIIPVEPVAPIVPLANTAPQTVEVASIPEPQTPDYVIPVPSRRPAVLIARTDAPLNRQSAQQLEAAINAANQTAPQVATAPTDILSDGGQAIAAVIDTAENPDEPATTLAYALPIPAPSPNRPSPTQLAALPTNEVESNLAPTQVAYAPSNREILLPQPRPLARQGKATIPSNSGKSGRVLQNTDQTQTAALDPVIPTTPKSGRPTVDDGVRIASTPEPKIVPADQINQDRFGSWTTASTSLIETGRVSAQPDFLQNAKRAVPNVLYTAGFSKEPPQETTRFSGNAVTFLAVAKFDSGVGSAGEGRGEPLQIRVPN